MVNPVTEAYPMVSLSCRSYQAGRPLITINAPLILKMRDIIFFFAGKLHNRPFQGIFRGGQKSRGPLEISREMAHYVVCPK